MRGGQLEVARQIAGRRRRIERRRRSGRRSTRRTASSEIARRRRARARPDRRGAGRPRAARRRARQAASCSSAYERRRSPSPDDETVAGVGARPLRQRLRQRPQCGHQLCDRSSTRRATCATTCATVRVAGTSFSGIEMSNRSSSSAITSRICSESKPRSATRSLLEGGFDGTPAHVLEHVDHAVFDRGRGRLGHQ